MRLWSELNTALDEIEDEAEMLLLDRRYAVHRLFLRVLIVIARTLMKNGPSQLDT